MQKECRKSFDKNKILQMFSKLIHLITFKNTSHYLHFLYKVTYFHKPFSFFSYFSIIIIRHIISSFSFSLFSSLRGVAPLFLSLFSPLHGINPLFLCLLPPPHGTPPLFLSLLHVIAPLTLVPPNSPSRNGTIISIVVLALQLFSLYSQQYAHLFMHFYHIITSVSLYAYDT